MDLNKCSKCKQDLVIGGSGTMCCCNDDCEIEVVGMIYNEPITIEEQGEKLLIPLVTLSFKKDELCTEVK